MQDITTQNQSEQVDINWSMFEKIETLGNGAFGKVYKVKCLQSTKISENGNERVLLTQKSLKNKQDSLNIKKSLSIVSNQTTHGRQLLKDQFYVIKVIEVGTVPEKVGIAALEEIGIMQELDSPYIVGYIDSFIVDQQINIVIEYCQMGDLHALIERQKMQGPQNSINYKPFVDNVIWKIFIHLCLGLHYLHSQNIVHRDLKSLNIFMVKENYAKIGDLGCAKRLNCNSQKEENKEQKQIHQKQNQQKQGINDYNSEVLNDNDNGNPFKMYRQGNQQSQDINMDADINLEDKLSLSDDSNLLGNNHDQGQAIMEEYLFEQQITPIVNLQEAKSKSQDLEVSRVGTPFYLAPELWKNPKYSRSSDIWALGVILYELCCLNYPFPASEMEELEKKVLNDKVQKHPNYVSTEHVLLFKKMLEKDPLKRPCVEEIIYSDIFQSKAQQNQITLPLQLNKQKLQHKFSVGQFGQLQNELTDQQKKFAGLHIPSDTPKSNQNQITSNLMNHNQQQKNSKNINNTNSSSQNRNSHLNKNIKNSQIFQSMQKNDNPFEISGQKIDSSNEKNKIKVQKIKIKDLIKDQLNVIVQTDEPALRKSQGLQMQNTIPKSNSEMFKIKQNEEANQSMHVSNSVTQIRTSQILNSKKQSIVAEQSGKPVSPIKNQRISIPQQSLQTNGAINQQNNQTKQQEHLLLNQNFAFRLAQPNSFKDKLEKSQGTSQQINQSKQSIPEIGKISSNHNSRNIQFQNKNSKQFLSQSSTIEQLQGESKQNSSKSIKATKQSVVIHSNINQENQSNFRFNIQQIQEKNIISDDQNDKSLAEILFSQNQDTESENIEKQKQQMPNQKQNQSITLIKSGQSGLIRPNQLLKKQDSTILTKVNSDNTNQKNSIKKQLLAQNNSTNKISTINSINDKSGDKEKPLRIIHETTLKSNLTGGNKKNTATSKNLKTLQIATNISVNVSSTSIQTMQTRSQRISTINQKTSGSKNIQNKKIENNQIEFNATSATLRQSNSKTSFMQSHPSIDKKLDESVVISKKNFETLNKGLQLQKQRSNLIKSSIGFTSNKVDDIKNIGSLHQTAAENHKKDNIQSATLRKTKIVNQLVKVETKNENVLQSQNSIKSNMNLQNEQKPSKIQGNFALMKQKTTTSFLGNKTKNSFQLTGSDKIKSNSPSSNASLSKSLSNKKSQQIHQEMSTSDRRRHNVTAVSPKNFIKNIKSFDKSNYQTASEDKTIKQSDLSSNGKKIISNSKISQQKTKMPSTLKSLSFATSAIGKSAGYQKTEEQKGQASEDKKKLKSSKQDPGSSSSNKNIESFSDKKTLTIKTFNENSDKEDQKLRITNQQKYQTKQNMQLSQVEEESPDIFPFEQSRDKQGSQTQRDQFQKIEVPLNKPRMSIGGGIKKFQPKNQNYTQNNQTSQNKLIIEELDSNDEQPCEQPEEQPQDIQILQNEKKDPAKMTFQEFQKKNKISDNNQIKVDQKLVLNFQDDQQQDEPQAIQSTKSQITFKQKIQEKTKECKNMNKLASYIKSDQSVNQRSSQHNSDYHSLQEDEERNEIDKNNDWIDGSQSTYLTYEQSKLYNKSSQSQVFENLNKSQVEPTHSKINIFRK